MPELFRLKKVYDRTAAQALEEAILAGAAFQPELIEVTCVSSNAAPPAQLHYFPRAFAIAR
ncbi:MAG: hypothetical protein WBF59_05750 [Bradyrhizobium sp.]|jgi:hypothetical protein|uniref:hypothetical protein n=1 Tax=Bradyrhizobium sp. TaxID=376 RepID=UPI003C707D0F